MSEEATFTIEQIFDDMWSAESEYAKGLYHPNKEIAWKYLEDVDNFTKSCLMQLFKLFGIDLTTLSGELFKEGEIDFFLVTKEKVEESLTIAKKAVMDIIETDTSLDLIEIKSEVERMNNEFNKRIMAAHAPVFNTWYM